MEEQKAQMNRRFDGFRKTPFLWRGALDGLEMFSGSASDVNGYPEIDTTVHVRLGKLTEQFVMYELEQSESTQILSANIQVFRNQITVGELDCLLRQAAVNIHLEMVYKFYLYDPSISPELNRWIGPNRNDSLVRKLDKLKHKQLPLLHHPETAKILKELQFQAADFVQQVHFRAQLFVPLDALKSKYPVVNHHCIVGFYMGKNEVPLFPNHTFYLPSKLDWLVEPHADVDWLSMQDFQVIISELVRKQKSPLCWMQSSDGAFHKLFVVWWAR